MAKNLIKIINNNAGGTTMKKSVRIQDDLYLYVNGEWEKTAQIPSDLPMTGSFFSIDEAVEKLLIGDFKKLSNGEMDVDIPSMKEAIKLYKMALDEKARNELGMKPLYPLLDKIKNIKNIDELNALSGELLKCGVNLPFEVMVNPDFKDSSKNCLAVMDPELILPDTSYYENKMMKKVMMSLYKDTVKKVLKFSPLSKKEQKQYLLDTIAFDELLRQKAKSHLELADYVKLYNPMDLDELNEKLLPFDFKGLLNQLYGNNNPQNAPIGTGNPRLVDGFKDIFNEKTFELYLHWAYVNLILNKASDLSFKIDDIAGTYGRKLMGIKKPATIEKRVFRLVSSIYSDSIGVYYGRKYFGEEAKKDIHSIVERIIETYKLRMNKNTFLTEETKQKAIAKLSAIKIKVGYPDDIDPFFDLLKVNEEESYFENISRLKRIRKENTLGEFLKKTDPKKWEMPGHMVNACYDPFRNEITFPAAILQKPFYDLNQTVSENLGGIGAVIGHEISHAFDNNGSHFDENGNLFDWWKEEDFKEFEKLTQLMVEQFDGIPFHGGKINGKLIVSENIADNGGVGVTLEIMNTIPDADYKLYFINWAKVWRLKAKEKFIRLLMTNDVHGPAVLRANIPPRNFKEWYEAFDVKETDQMYIPEEKRISIW